jgi:hypothetical protein
LSTTAQSFSKIGALFTAREDMTLAGSGEPEPIPQSIKAARVSASFLRTLGIQPAMGRGFLPKKTRPVDGPCS